MGTCDKEGPLQMPQSQYSFPQTGWQADVVDPAH